MKFSLIIPTRNERDDIAETLENCLAIDHPSKEVIVVDDSSDDTASIAKSFADRGVRVIQRDSNRNGCCGARNVGMQAATGDVVVIINADVRPRRDFLTRLQTHYEGGADFVVCFSNATNTDSLWAAYIHAQELEWRETTNMLWAEGFSCRREAAEAVNYIPGDFPIPFCRDWRLGESLERVGYKRHVASEILIDHRAHDSLAEFWSVRVARASWAPLAACAFRERSTRSIVIREFARQLTGVLLIATLFIPLRRALSLSRRVEPAHYAGFFFASMVSEAARVVGSIKGLRKLRQARSDLADWLDPYPRQIFDER
jgi:glycosyltransferase involved in cell wall biosynthesis